MIVSLSEPSSRLSSTKVSLGRLGFGLMRCWSSCDEKLTKTDHCSKGYFPNLSLVLQPFLQQLNSWEFAVQETIRLAYRRVFAIRFAGLEVCRDRGIFVLWLLHFPSLTSSFQVLKVSLGRLDSALWSEMLIILWWKINEPKGYL